jgi:hypothetical protein
MTIEPFSEQAGPAPAAGSVARPRLPRILKATAIAVAVLGFQGCGDTDELPEITKQAVKYDDVPEDVRTAANKAIPGIKFTEAWKNLGPGGKLHSYEIRGKNAANGQTREVRVSLTGEILEKE